LSTKINNPVRISEVQFQQFPVNERICVECNKRSDCRHSSKDLEFFIDRTVRASISSFSALRQFINAFPFFPRNSGRGGPHKWITLRPRIS